MKYIATLLLLTAFSSCSPDPDLTFNSLMPPPDPLYTEDGQIIPDFIPCVNPFVNEGCGTSWANTSAIVLPDGELVYFVNLPDHTDDENDLDKSRFTFIYQVRNPWFGIFEDEEPYAHLQTNWYTLPINDYGNLVCEGLQELRIWVLDELTGTWYMNSQIVWVAVLCNGQDFCDHGFSFDQIEYTPYDGGYLHISPTSISNY